MFNWFSPRRWFGGEKDDQPDREAKNYPGEFFIREYRTPDRREVLEIAEKAFEGVSLDENIEAEFGKLGKSWREHKVGAVDYDLQHNPSLTLVAEADQQVVGFVCNRHYPARSLGHIANLAVKKNYRGKKIGRFLVEDSLDLLKARGADFVRIETLQQNRLGQNLYPSLGFREVGRQIFYVKPLS